MALQTKTIASMTRRLLRKLSAPDCIFGALVLDGEAAVSAATTANDVMVVSWPFGSCVVMRTRLETVPPPGVYVVTKTPPFAFVAVTILPGVTLARTTVCPAVSVVVTSVGFVFAVEATNTDTGDVVTTPSCVTTAAGAVVVCTTVLPFEFVVVIS
jgi:hypothetical protein